MIGFEPLVVPIGPWALRAFGLLALVGLGVAVAMTWRGARRQGLSTSPIAHALVWAIPVGVIAARAVHVLGWWDYYLTHGSEIGQLSPDGLSLWGGLVGGGLVAWAALHHDRRRRVIFELAAPGVLLGIAIGRFGQFLDGYGQGVPSSLPWATQYASRLMAAPDFGVPRHPVQVYDGLIALALFALLCRIPRHWRSSTALVIYASASLALAPLRLAPAFLFGLQIEQMLAAATLTLGVLVALRSARVLERAKLRKPWREADPVLET